MSNNKLQPVRGTHDILPDEARQRHFITEAWRCVAELYGYGEIQTPVFEFSEVFHRTLGDTSDVVTKETYTFDDRGGESLTLRPEFTAAVVRAFISEGKLVNQLPVRFYYHGPAFRYERPQKGRMRQFHQVGAELLGASEPQADIEMIAMGWQLMQRLGVEKTIRIEINSLGDTQSRDAYRSALVEYLSAHKAKLSEDSQARLEKNPLRILDSKDESDREVIKAAPEMHAYFTDDAKAFYAQVLSGLEVLGIEVRENQKLVRGLDYYNHTVFEFIAAEGLGAQSTVLAGGRYDGLVEMMGGKSTPGVGFGSGIERLLILMENLGIATPPAPAPVAVVPVGEEYEMAAWQLVQQLRQEMIPADIAYRGNVGKRMKRADKIGAALVVMLGEDEVSSGKVSVKNLATGEQKTIAQSALITEIRAVQIAGEKE